MSYYFRSGVCYTSMDMLRVSCMLPPRDPMKKLLMEQVRMDALATREANLGSLRKKPTVKSTAEVVYVLDLQMYETLKKAGLDIPRAMLRDDIPDYVAEINEKKIFPQIDRFKMYNFLLTGSKRVRNKSEVSAFDAATDLIEDEAHRISLGPDTRPKRGRPRNPVPEKITSMRAMLEEKCEELDSGEIVCDIVGITPDDIITDKPEVEKTRKPRAPRKERKPKVVVADG